MRHIYKEVIAIAGAIAFGFLIGARVCHAEEKFSSLPEKYYLFTYYRSINLPQVKLDTIYTVAQVEKLMHCKQYFVVDFAIGKDVGLMVLGVEGEESKFVFMLQGSEQEMRI